MLVRVKRANVMLNNTRPSLGLHLLCTPPLVSSQKEEQASRFNGERDGRYNYFASHGVFGAIYSSEEVHPLQGSAWETMYVSSDRRTQQWRVGDGIRWCIVIGDDPPRLRQGCGAPMEGAGGATESEGKG